MGDVSYNSKNYQGQGGDNWHVGGTLDIDAAGGGKLTVNGADVTSSVSGAAVAGVAAGYIIARGEAVLDGANPTPIATGLTTVIVFVATLKGSVAPGVGTSTITAVVSGGTANVYGWKPTSNADPTLIASAGTDGFYWIAVGI
jgi:hypothetical protein